jgi:hypothetical protein
MVVTHCAIWQKGRTRVARAHLLEDCVLFVAERIRESGLSMKWELLDLLPTQAGRHLPFTKTKPFASMHDT